MNLTVEDEFFIDNDGYVIVADPQHGHSSQLRKATEADKEVYEQKVEQRRLGKPLGKPPGARHDWI